MNVNIVFENIQDKFEYFVVLGERINTALDNLLEVPQPQQQAPSKTEKEGFDFTDIPNIKIDEADVVLKDQSNAVETKKGIALPTIVTKDAPKEEKPVKEEAPAKEKATKVKKAEKEDLSSHTVAELREMAKAKEIKGYSTMKKAELIEALS